LPQPLKARLEQYLKALIICTNLAHEESASIPRVLTA